MHSVVKNSCEQWKQIKKSAHIKVHDERLEFCYDDLKEIKVLGQGQFGSVCKMALESGDKTYYFAVKRVRDTVDNVHREYKVGKLGSKCKHTVATYAIMRFDGGVCIVMQLMDASIQELHRQRQELKLSFPEIQVAYITKCVLKGLEYLRKKDIQHRDVKPSNMLCDTKGQVKICDYGVSQTMNNDITKTNVGTHLFMAPERMRGADDEGFRIQSDVWSLGASVYYIITNKPLFEKDTTIFECCNLLREHTHLQLPEDAGCSPEMHQFVAACLQVDSKCRPSFETLLETPLLTAFSTGTHKPKFAEFVLETLQIPPSSS